VSVSAANNSNWTKPKKRLMGLTLRTALLSWLVTLATLLTFVIVIIPQQKRNFLENLESKAHGVAVSLRDVAAGAVVNEDFSTVVDHCKEILQGDGSLEYLVITKNDGFSLFNDRDGWRCETNASKVWRPEDRQPAGGIATVAPFRNQVFHFSQPFDYSGIQWGWIHVGLSLRAYQLSVAQVYRRTGILAIVCILVSLAASMIYARQLVRPVLHLRQIVGQVAGGDLTVRARIERTDEVGSLAASVNSMTEALLKRDLILQSVRFAAQEFLEARDWRDVINDVLARIGRAGNVSRVSVYENEHLGVRASISSCRFEWRNADFVDQPPLEPQDFKWGDTHFAELAARLAAREAVSIDASSVDPVVRNLLGEQHIESLLLIPIQVENAWWGFLRLDDCARDRFWTNAERDSIRAAADMLGAAITRQRTQDALLEAKGTLEQRVQERTHQLQKQVQAKEQAIAELAEAQQRLMDVSRAAGMAEVATGVLHNVGNVLNSVSVSATIVASRLKRSKTSKLAQASDILREHHDHLAEFLTTNTQGKILPEYLCTVSEQISVENAEILAEINLLHQNIQHINEIVAMQQNYAKVSGAFEHLGPAEVVEDALRMNTAAFQRHQIEIIRDYAPGLPQVNVDRHKVLQILINLLRNAKQALSAERANDKRLTVSIKCRENVVAIHICDNGIGISSENLTRIFQHGFTTKKDGHGFGLHSGANAAKEIGGRLIAHSNGPGQGAEFILELPIANHSSP